MSDDQRRSLFALLLRGPANTWFNTVHDSDKVDFDTLSQQFLAKYAPAPITQWRRASEMWSRDQRPDETVEEYGADMMSKAKDVHAAEEMARFAIMRGLRPQLKAYVMQQNPQTVTDLLDAAKVAEATIDTSQPSMTELMEAITRLQHSVITPLSTPQQPSSAARRLRSPPPFQRQPSRRHQVNNDSVRGPSRRVDFADRSFGGQQRQFMARRQPQHMNSRSQQIRSGCTFCGRYHNRGACPAYGKECRNCGRMNHFAVRCRQGRPPMSD